MRSTCPFATIDRRHVSSALQACKKEPRCHRSSHHRQSQSYDGGARFGQIRSLVSGRIHALRPEVVRQAWSYLFPTSRRHLIHLYGRFTGECWHPASGGPSCSSHTEEILQGFVWRLYVVASSRTLPCYHSTVIAFLYSPRHSFISVAAKCSS